VNRSIGLSAPAFGTRLGVRRTTPDLIAEALREAIYSGQLADGAELNQAAVAEHFEVSRVPVREAMRALQAEGLISAEAHRRPTVRGLSVERVLELFDLRQLIEGYLVERATPLVTGDTLTALHELVNRMLKVVDHDQWMRINNQFHAELYSASGATTAMAMAESLRGRAERYLRIWSDGKGFDRAAPATREHASILDRVQAGDAAGARAEIEAHIAHTRERAEALAAKRAPITSDADHPAR